MKAKALKACGVCGEMFAFERAHARYCANPECKREGRRRANNTVRARCATRKRRRDPEAKARQRRWERESRARYPERLAAGQAVRTAVQSGRLVKPDACSICNKVLPAAKLQGHHHAGYAKADRLNVVWLCSACHREEDRREAESAHESE